ncbi:hypothetical protein HYW67_04070 [Candidatus Parcubacteria bacterium]|nr:hypothetical protein [Candidatus Parcubacteria bacterium]
MEGQVRTFQVERLTSDEAEFAKEMSHVLAELRLLKFWRGMCPFMGGVLGALASFVVAIFADQLAAAFAVPLPPPSPSGSIRRVAVGLGVSFLFVIFGWIVGRFIEVPLFVEPRRRRTTEKLNQLIFLSESQFALALQKLRRIAEACGELHEMAREGHSLPLSADDLPEEVREFYPRTI